MTSMDDKEERIINAATPLFAERGLKKTTVDDIAEAAGVGKGTVYLYFESKAAILAAVIRREGRTLLARARNAARRKQGGIEPLRTFFLSRFRYVDELLVLHRVSHERLRELRPEIEFALQEMILEERTLVGGFLEDGVDAGELEVDDIPLVSMAITAAMDAVHNPWLYEGREMRLEKKIQILLELFVNGMRPGPKSAASAPTNPTMPAAKNS